MKDLILNFSLDKLVSLPPTELLAFLAIAFFAVSLLLGVVFFALRAIFD